MAGMPQDELLALLSKQPQGKCLVVAGSPAWLFLMQALRLAQWPVRQREGAFLGLFGGLGLGRAAPLAAPCFAESAVLVVSNADGLRC
jgi:hypothetical protein